MRVERLARKFGKYLRTGHAIENKLAQGGSKVPLARNENASWRIPGAIKIPVDNHWKNQKEVTT
jgi:hypothetical protein